jgi:hypothetical protein
MLPILIAATFWLLFLVFIISLCKAAARGDEQMSHPLQLVYSAEWEREENTRTAQPKVTEKYAAAVKSYGT